MYIIDWFNRMTKGQSAVVVQSYNEANSKNGSNFELSALFTGAVLGTPSKAVFLTGDLPVILKDRSFGYSGSAIQADIFKNPVYTGGTPLPYQNTNDINPAVGGVTILQSPTVTSDGAKLASTVYLLGGAKSQNKGSASVTAGAEYILKPNTAYLFSVQSLDSQAQDITVHNGWFEGYPDLPLSN